MQLKGSFFNQAITDWAFTCRTFLLVAAGSQQYSRGDSPLVPGPGSRGFPSLCTCCWSSSQPRDAQAGSVPVFPLSLDSVQPKEQLSVGFPQLPPQHLLLAWAGFDQNKPH